MGNNIFRNYIQKWKRQRLVRIFLGNSFLVNSVMFTEIIMTITELQQCNCS